MLFMALSDQFALLWTEMFSLCIAFTTIISIRDNHHQSISAPYPEYTFYVYKCKRKLAFVHITTDHNAFILNVAEIHLLCLIFWKESGSKVVMPYETCFLTVNISSCITFLSIAFHKQIAYKYINGNNSFKIHIHLYGCVQSASLNSTSFN